MSRRIFCTTDTHGCLNKLRNCLVQANFDYENDTLIHLGDCVDRGPDSKGVIELLLSIKNLISLKGNHDDWFLQVIDTGVHPANWNHGGWQTRLSYSAYGIDPADFEDLDRERQSFVSTLNVPQCHREFFKNQRLHYTDEQGRFFCHAGFNRHKSIDDQDDDFMFYWDRDLFLSALSANDMRFDSTFGDKPYKFKIKDKFKRVFIGHTPTINWKKKENPLNGDWLPNGVPIDKPIYAGQICNLDTGGCFGGKISLLDITDDEHHILFQNTNDML